MATIVYEGAGGGGDLFAGLKFYFLRRVPLRPRWEELVVSNGGELVKLEKQADIVIADHARKDNPAGSISWKYVEESIKKGELEDIEDHRAGPVTHTAREIGSGGPTRKGRTPFTAEDDRTLMNWVMQGERAGIAVKGNELFQQLEEKNPRHTFQSWRDRWIKYVQHHPRPGEADRSQSPPDGPAPASKAKKGKSATQQRHASSSSQGSELRRPGTQLYHNSSLSRQVDEGPLPASSKSIKARESEMQSTNPWVAKSKSGIHFSTQEIRLLSDNYDNIVNIDKDREIDAWAAWAVEYPDHTPQEWRNYFVKELAPLIEKARGQKSKRTRQPKPSSTHSSISAERNVDFDGPDIEVGDSQPAKLQPTDPTLEDENHFETELLNLASALPGAVEEVTFNPTICGKEISLFRLWQIIKSSEFGGRDEVTGRKLWPRVARKLNFTGSQQAEAASALKATYDEILADFEELREGYLDTSESQQIQQQLLSTIAEDAHLQQNESDEEDIDDDLDAPLASPAVYSSGKGRVAYRTSQDVYSVAGPAQKRQRVEKGKEREIPSTPEEKININQMPSIPYQASPLKSYQTIDEQQEGDKDEDLFVRPLKRPDFSILQTPKRIQEPETQDFQFDFQEEGAEDFEEDLAPSISLGPSPRQAAGGQSVSPANSDDYEGSSTQSQTESQRAADLRAFIDRHVAIGYTEAVVCEALEATTMNTGYASDVMEALTKDEGIPGDVEGVWTKSDDAALEDEDSSEFERILAKHGRQRTRLRQKFLEDQREAKRVLDESWLDD